MARDRPSLSLIKTVNSLNVSGSVDSLYIVVIFICMSQVKPVCTPFAKPFPLSVAFGGTPSSLRNLCQVLLSFEGFPDCMGSCPPLNSDCTHRVRHVGLYHSNARSVVGAFSSVCSVHGMYPVQKCWFMSLDMLGIFFVFC